MSVKIPPAHPHDSGAWRHSHDFVMAGEAESERRMLWVTVLTAAMMVAEIAAGLVWNSMAVLADGWHMGTHAAALAIAWFAYRHARRHRASTGYSFGPGKVHGLASYTSALFLGLVAVWVIAESVQALFDPKIIAFRESMGVAMLGLGVNLLSAYLLRGDAHEHGHASHHGHSHSHDPADGHGHSHEHEHAHHADHAEADVNRKAAFAHVVVDAMTSVLAIVALVADRYLGWRMLDPLVGIVGGIIIARWSLSLVAGALPLLLDRDPSPGLSAAIRKRLEAEPDTEVTDLHVWQVAPGKRAAVVAVLTHGKTDAERYKTSLADFGLAHLSVEVNRCADCAAHGSRSAG